MEESVEKKSDRMRKVLNLQHPDRMPSSGDWGFIEYRRDVYHLPEPEFVVKPGKVGVSRNGKRKYTHDVSFFCSQVNYSAYKIFGLRKRFFTHILSDFFEMV